MEIEVERVVTCRSPVGALWPLVADTERTNRAIGMEPVRYRPASGAGAARFVGATNLGGFDVEYEERPTEWVRERSFRISRRMSSGPVSRLDLRFTFEPQPSGSRVVIRMVNDARMALLSPVIRMRTRQSIERIAREIERVDAALARGQRPSLPLPARVNDDALGAAMKALRASCPAALAERLEQHVRHADDVDITRMRPHALAAEWGVPPRELLAAMLHAVKAGLLELRWELICPSCRVAVDTVPTLAELGDHGSCQLCEIDFKLELDEALEATFSPVKAVRAVAEGPFCIAGPARTPHVLSQAILPARGRAELPVPGGTEGRCRVFVRGGASAQLRVTPDGPDRIQVDADALPAEVTLRPGGVVELLNNIDAERHAKLERSEWVRQAVTARELTSMPAFRREFSSDLLRPGASLKVSRVSLFFSDLTGSTQLYSTIGDAAAFRLVQDHFDLVLGLIEQHGGALVKTIGDAVMAVFASDLDGVAASVAILDAFEEFRGGHEHRQMTHIKLGLHGGSCYVVTANGVLDYFGQTVNIAARLQAQADSGELVISRALAAEAVEAGVIDADQIRATYAASLKGVNAPIEVARVSTRRRVC